MLSASIAPAVDRPEVERLLLGVRELALELTKSVEMKLNPVIAIADGHELGISVYAYANGVIDEALPAPDGDVKLAPEWALQDPDDYLRTFQQAIPAAIADSGVDRASIIGVGVDFTACTMLPTKADGTPNCVVSSSDDCKRAAACKERGRCEARDMPCTTTGCAGTEKLCVVTSATDCKRSSGCAGSGACGLSPGATACAPSAADNTADDATTYGAHGCTAHDTAA
mgnify:CR=1 FL=1